jgi:cell division protein FtsB
MASREPSPRQASLPAPVFWKELYWFAILCLAGATFAALVLPPRAARHRSLLALESELAARMAKLEHQERVLEAAIASVESDPFYREAVYRSILGVKKAEEEFLHAPAPGSR